MIELNKEDKEHVLATLDGLENIDEAMALFAQAVYGDAVDKADMHTKSGAMVRSLYLHKTEDGFEMGADASIAPYAVFVHWGSKPHFIHPKEKKALRWANGKGFLFAKWVKHPGYKGDPFFYDALEENVPKLNRYFERFIDDL